MRFSNGMLGVTVVAVALAAALLGSWALSTEVTQKEVTTYSQLSDSLSGLFDTVKSPEYIEYSPSSNYTGYYTDDSVQGSVVYFDGVDYGVAQRANTYRLNLGPTAQTGTNVQDLSQLTSASGTWAVMYYTAADNYYSPFTSNHLSVTDLISQMGLTGYTQYVFYNTNDVSGSGWTQAGSFTAFVTGSQVYDTATANNKNIVLKDPRVTDRITANIWAGQVAVTVPYMAMKYEPAVGQVQLFYDRDMEQSAGFYNPSDVHILWNGATGNPFYFDDEVTYYALQYPPTTYMDPSKGVEVDA